jgi:hypothetical protein
MHAARTRNEPFVILGAGYVGQWVHALAAAQGWNAFGTSRDPDRRLAHLPASQRLRFDLEDAATWSNLPCGSTTLWCFPAQPLRQVLAFSRAGLSQPARLLMLGSTSAYDAAAQASEQGPGPWIDEACPIDRSLPRVAGEEYLRERHGAIILRVAGIYGPGRNPLNWLRQGRITNLHRTVNLIHVADLAEICLLALQAGRPGDVYNVSDGTPRLWKDIADAARSRWGVDAPPSTAAACDGKRISNAKLRTELGYTFRYPDLYAALNELETK